MRDIIVIGSGAGGAVVAKELAARGLDVLVLEAGMHHKNSEQDFTHFEIDQSSPVNGVLRFGPSDRTRQSWARELPQHSVITQIAGVGGTTLHYLGNSPRAMPGAFKGYSRGDWAAYDRTHQFPFSYQELIPYYEWVEETLPVQTAPMGTKEEIFLNAAASIGLWHQTSKNVERDSFRPQENAILQPQGQAGKTGDPKLVQHPSAKGCVFCGHCVPGCNLPLGAPRNLKAKRSMDNSYIPMALTADLWARGGKAITLVPNAFAVKILKDTAGRANGVTWRNTITGDEATETARVVVLSAGCIESPRLWLNSGLPNPNGWVGRGLTDHHMDMVVGILPYDGGASRGPGSAARADFPGRGILESVGAGPAITALFAASSDSGIIGRYDNGAPVGPAGADAVGRYAGRALKNFYRNVDRLMTVLVFTDDDVETQNGVSLSAAFPSDEHGPVPRVVMNGRGRSARTKTNRDFLAGKAVEIMRAAGGTSITRFNLAPILLHLHSSMRMGEDATNSVLDESGEAREVKRLFVADGSALANSIGGPNPTLTIDAVATRTAEKIFRRYFGGDPWVRSERPVSSIDPQVTKAVLARGI